MLRDILESMFKKPVTRHYPAEASLPPEGLRGKLHWNGQGCTGCSLCVKDCPAAAIELITVDKAQKRFVMRYHADRCVFCAQCLQNCRFDNFTLEAGEWELAAGDRSGYTVLYGDPEDVKVVQAAERAAELASAAATDTAGTDDQ